MHAAREGNAEDDDAGQGGSAADCNAPTAPGELLHRLCTASCCIRSSRRGAHPLPPQQWPEDSRSTRRARKMRRMRACRRVICVGSCICAAVAQVQARVWVLMRFWRLQSRPGRFSKSGTYFLSRHGSIGASCCHCTANSIIRCRRRAQAAGDASAAAAHAILQTSARASGAAQTFILARVSASMWMNTNRGDLLLTTSA